MLKNLFQRVSNFAYSMTRRQYIRIRNLLILLIFLIAISCGCIIHIDHVCGLGSQKLPVLPDSVEAMPVIADQAVPAAPLYDIPLSKDLQEYTYQKCIQYDVDYIMVLAIIQEESEYQAELIEDGNYGLMQINEGNFEYLMNALGTKDFLDPKQNIEAGVFWLSGIFQNNSDPERILMVYNMNGSVAQEFWDLGRYSTWYSREVMRYMDEISEKQLQV